MVHKQKKRFYATVYFSVDAKDEEQAEKLIEKTLKKPRKGFQFGGTEIEDEESMASRSNKVNSGVRF